MDENNHIFRQSDRLILRAFEMRDAEAFAAYRSDPAIARFQGWSTPFHLNKAREFIDEMTQDEPGIPGSWYQMAIELKSQPGLIGDCGFHVLRQDHEQAEIGYTIAQGFHQNGYGTEAVSLLLDYLFHDLELHRITATCDIENTASWRLLEKVGFRREGHFVESYFTDSGYRDDYFYAILKREWQT